MRKKRLDNKGRVLRVGEFQRSEDNRYIYRYTGPTGKKITVYAATLQELREKEDQINKDLQDGIDTAKGDMTLNQLFKVYMETKTDLRESTRQNYNGLWKNAIQESVIGNMKIADIKQIHIRTFYSELVKEGLSANTIKFYHTMIFPALELAVDSDIIRKNPAKDCLKNIGGTKRERVALTRDQQAALMEHINQSGKFTCYAPMITFALETGLRVGEFTGLRWSDVDLKNNMIHVRQQLIYKNFGDGCKFHVTDLKTDAGRRDIPLTHSARESLIRQRELVMMMGTGAKCLTVDGISDFVFTNSQGKPFATNAVNLVLKNAVDSYNKQVEDKDQLLPHVSAHILRHTFCTRMAESGLDPKVLQYIMGHSKVSITLDVYTHLDFSQIQKSMEGIQGSLKIG